MNEPASRGRAILILLAALISVMLTTRLGLWQLDRAAEKQSLHDTRIAKQKLPPLRNLDLTCDGATWTQQEQREAMVQGQWLHEKSVILDNRTMAERSGFFVLTPLLLMPAPKCGAAVLLVQRGWLPRDAADRTRIPPWEQAPGLVQLRVRLSFAPSKSLSLQSQPIQETGLLRQNVDLNALGLEWQLALLPGSAQQLADDDSAVQVQTGQMPLLRGWWQPIAGVEKHQAYAAQWFLMALTITGLYLWFQWWRPARDKAIQTHNNGALKQ